MTRNTKEVALIQIRSGKLSEMPKALHQSEYGLAKDANRLFIGNASNPLLKNRTIFPYQNLEILTEFTDLKDYFKYSYENNITFADGTTDRLKLKEFLPIVISCHQPNPTITSAGAIEVNGVEISVPAGDMYSFIQTINNFSQNTGVYSTVFPGTRVVTFVSTSNELKIGPKDPDNPNDTGIITAIGFIEEPYDISMPVRKVTEKLDDRLDIADFGIKGDVRDLVIKRKDSNWEIGLSIKHNHDAVKHSRLSHKIDFGAEWFDKPCHQNYWSTVNPIFDRLKILKAENKAWSDIKDKSNSVHLPICLNI